MVASWFKGTVSDAQAAFGAWCENPSEDIKGVKRLKRLAKRGNVEAQYLLGLGLVSDCGGKNIQNISEAIKWFKLASDNGDLRAHDQLWQAYLHEGNVNEEKALTYLLIAAKKGVTNAQRFLGICYMEGSILPVPKNYSEGIMWLTKAATSDRDASQDAQIELGKAYRDGTGVNVDLTKSYVWFSIASRAEVANQRRSAASWKKWNAANPKYAFPYEIKKGEAQVERDKIAERLTKSQLMEAQELTERYIVTNYEVFARP
jgi:TPR repeat protein